MKSSTIQRVIAISAIGLALPLGIYGFRSLFHAGAGRAGNAASSSSQSPPLPRPEITLRSGDSTAINNVLHQFPTQGGTLILGKATFAIHDPIVIDRDDVELRGSGSDTILRLSDHSACPVIVIGSTLTPTPHIVTRVTLRRLTIDGNRHKQDPECWGGICDTGGVTFIRNNALTIRGASHITIENLLTRNARSGGVVLEKNCRHISIDNLESTDNHFDGLACYETEESTFNRLHLHHNSAAGISLDLNFHHNTFKSADLHHNGSQGVFMRQSSHNQFIKFKIHDNGNQGIFIAQADNDPATAATHNIFTDISVAHNVGQGIRINDPSCTDNMVRNSQIKDNPAGNISLALPDQLSGLGVTDDKPPGLEETAAPP